MVVRRTWPGGSCGDRLGGLWLFHHDTVSRSERLVSLPGNGCTDLRRRRRRRRRAPIFVMASDRIRRADLLLALSMALADPRIREIRVRGARQRCANRSPDRTVARARGALLALCGDALPPKAIGLTTNDLPDRRRGDGGHTLCVRSAFRAWWIAATFLTRRATHPRGGRRQRVPPTWLLQSDAGRRAGRPHLHDRRCESRRADFRPVG